MTKVTLSASPMWATLRHMGHSCGNRYADTHRGFVQHAQKAGTIGLIMFAILVVSGFSMVWPVIVMAVLAVKLGAHARRVYGARDDTDAADEADEADEREPEFTIV